MTSEDSIPSDIRRFILTSIDSVPHLEAVLLLRANPTTDWDAKAMAQRLFINEKRAAEVLAGLKANGFADVKKEPVLLYYYSPATIGLQEMMDRLAQTYSTHLIEVTNLIHSKINKQAQQFGDAFKWQE